MPQDRFIEIFPITAVVPRLAAYTLHLKQATDAGGRIAYRLGKALGGRWVWADQRLLTNEPVSPVQLDITLDLLRQQDEQLLRDVTGVTEDTTWAQHPQAVASYILQTAVRDHEEEVHQALLAAASVSGLMRAERQASFRPWNVAGEPALSISVQWQVVYAQPLQELLVSRNEKLKSAIGWAVMDRTNPSMTGIIEGGSGVLGLHRERLLGLTRRPAMQALLAEGADTTLIVRVQTPSGLYEYPANALYVALSPEAHDALRTLEIPASLVHKAMRLSPAQRANLVKIASDILKREQIISSAYNSRTHPHLFGQLDFTPALTYGENRTRPYQPRTAADDFLKGKVYRRHLRFRNAPITIGVINTLDEKIDDFVEALRRMMEKDFGFQIRLLKERRVRVVAEKNVESAVRVIEKEEPDIVLAFFEDAQRPADDEESQAHYLKALTLGKGIATHTIYQKTMNDPDAMPLIIMSILGKTGNTPFALSEPLEYADLVVGLTITRQSLTRGDRVVGLARIYRSDGTFMQYVMDALELAAQEPIPYILFQTLFPQELFAQQRVIIHHEGPIPADIRRLLLRWAEVAGSAFYLVEVERWGAPRLYGLEKGVTQAGWGSVFLADASLGFVVTSAPQQDATAQPLAVRVVESDLPVDLAIYSVLVWTLLHYGAQGTHKLPVTLHNGDQMAAWMARGSLPARTSGDMPFWL
jgi:hypothetical protein